MVIPSSQLPDGFADRPQDFANFLFVASVHKWNEKSKMAHGKLITSLGNAGDIAAETEALLVLNQIDTCEFPPEILNTLPSGENWTIDEVIF